jgi:hypothetical protein
MSVNLPPGHDPYIASYAEPGQDSLVPAQVDQYFDDAHDDDDRAARLRSPFDSHYDMAAMFDETPDESGAEIPAFDPGSSGEFETVTPATDRSSADELFQPSPWYYKFINSWGRFQFVAGLGFAASALSVLGFLLARAIVAGQTVSTSVTALVLGCVGTIAFLLLSLSATALIMLLADLDRNVRQLIQQADRDAAAARDQARWSHPKLSQPVA